MRSDKAINYFRRAEDLYKDECDYSESEYFGSKKPLTIKCNKHNIFFTVLAHNHLKNKGCPECRKENYGNHLRLDQNSFLEKCYKIHGDFYDYSLAIYKGYEYKVKIICPLHGEFSQLVKNHLSGANCQKCKLQKTGFSNRLTDNEKEEYFSACAKTHNNKYDYSMSNFEKVSEKITIICPIHGEFYQVATHHKKGNGCQQCGYEKIGSSSRLTKEIFIQRSESHFGKKYDYSFVHDFKNIKERVKIICSSCGEFSQFVEVHIKGHGCPNCVHCESKWELQVREYLLSLGIDDIHKNRKLISPFEIDLYSPSYKIAIECNGNYYHSERLGGKKATYHLRKTLKCDALDVEMVHIFEDEWAYKNSIVKSILSSKFKKLNSTIFARKTIIQDLSKNEKNEFLSENHLFGSDNSHIRLGLMYDNKIVSCMTFIKHKNDEYVLNRFANKIFTNIPGSASKLFSYFVKMYCPKKVTTLADKRWSNGNVYKVMNFKRIEKRIRPTYTYTKNYMKREHKMNFRKSKLPKKLQNYDCNKTEKENMFNHGYDRIWDCGHITFEWISDV